MANIKGKKLGVPAVRALKRRNGLLRKRNGGDKTRSLNVKGCFSPFPPRGGYSPKVGAIILDDVVTSGGTIKEAAPPKALHPYQIIL
jgi:predicted amidophosphoribosyltransferase